MKSGKSYLGAVALGLGELARSHCAAAEDTAKRWQVMVDDGDHPGLWRQAGSPLACHAGIHHVPDP